MTGRRTMTALAIAVLGSSTAAAQPGADLPAPVEPAPVEAPPVEPAPVAPAPVESAPVAAAPAEPEAPASDEPAIDDEDLLAELGLDNGGFDNKLHLYGFAEFGMIMPIVDDQAAVASAIPKEGTFYGAALNLYLTKALSTRWRSMLEVRLTYAPAGKVRADGTYETATDPDLVFGPTQWGGVVIERAHLEYAYDDHLAIQVGTYLTPYGIWNVDHGAPAIIGGARPWIIGQELFPEHQTGLHAYGKHAFGAYTLGYHATLSNGRGPLDSFHDLDRNKALGGRLELHAPWLGGLDVGMSVYAGKFTDRPADVIAPDANGNLVTVTPPGISYDEVAVAFDARLQHGPLVLQTEAILSKADFVDGGRAAQRIGYQPDARGAGGYVLAAYRIDALGGLMPFATFEGAVIPSTADSGHRSTFHVISGGLNYRPIADVVLKLVYGQARSSGLPIEYDFDYVDARAAWVF